MKCLTDKGFKITTTSSELEGYSVRVGSDKDKRNTNSEDERLH